jgi:UDP-N-acetylmuramyl pentapeptide synthase
MCVRDTAAALLRLGALARGRVGGAIGVTGSVGKTTTKDLLAGCLASTFRIAASERSFNNELGLPLTLLGAPDAARWVVLEMGVRRVGDIERLAEVRSESEHRRIALLAEELRIDLVGYETDLYGDAHVTGVEEAVAVLRTMGPRDAALVKGSRVTRLEDVVRAYRRHIETHIRAGNSTSP